jgi:hypothetical protein
MSHITKSLQTPNKRFTSSEPLKTLHPDYQIAKEQIPVRMERSLIYRDWITRPGGCRASGRAVKHSGLAAHFKFPYTYIQQISYDEVQTGKLAEIP